MAPWRTLTLQELAVCSHALDFLSAIAGLRLCKAFDTEPHAAVLPFAPLGVGSMLTRTRNPTFLWLKNPKEAEAQAQVSL